MAFRVAIQPTRPSEESEALARRAACKSSLAKATFVLRDIWVWARTISPRGARYWSTALHDLVLTRGGREPSNVPIADERSSKVRSVLQADLKLLRGSIVWPPQMALAWIRASRTMVPHGHVCLCFRSGTVLPPASR